MNANNNNIGNENDAITPEGIAKLDLPPESKETLLRIHQFQCAHAEQLNRREEAVTKAPTFEQESSSFDCSKPQSQQLNDCSTTAHDSSTASHSSTSAPHNAPSPAHESSKKANRLLELRQIRSDQTLGEIQFELQTHHQARYPIEELAPADRKTLYELLQSHSTYDVANALPHPRPHGLGISVSPSALAQFKRRYAQTMLDEERAQAQQAAREIIESGCGPESFTQAAEHLLKLRLYQATNDPSTDSEELARLFKIHRDLRRQTLAERIQQHAEQKTKPS